MPERSNMARPVEVEYVCTNNYPPVTSLIFHPSSVHSEMIEISGVRYAHKKKVFVHKHLLHERSPYLKECIDEGEKEDDSDDPDDRGPLVVKLDRNSHTACIKLACWVYGQPIHESTYDFDQDLEDLVGIHAISFKTEDDSSKWDMECIHPVSKESNRY
jgi:hypothetical protein